MWQGITGNRLARGLLSTGLALAAIFALVTSSALAVSDEELAALYRTGDLAGMEEVARTGDVRAEAWMGLMLQQRQRRAEAKEWWRRAAEKGNRWALSSLASMHWQDGEDEEAAEWLRRGAEAGHAWSQVNYADVLLAGRGVPKNEREAIRWYSAATEQGEKYAYLPLAELYVAGTGVERDLVVAYALATIAEMVLDSSDFEPEAKARALRQRLAKGLSAEQRKVAFFRAHERHPDFRAIQRASWKRDLVLPALLLSAAGGMLGATALMIAAIWGVFRWTRRRSQSPPPSAS